MLVTSLALSSIYLAFGQDRYQETILDTSSVYGWGWGKTAPKQPIEKPPIANQPSAVMQEMLTEMEAITSENTIPVSLSQQEDFITARKFLTNHDNDAIVRATFRIAMSGDLQKYLNQTPSNQNSIEIILEVKEGIFRGAQFAKSTFLKENLTVKTTKADLPKVRGEYLFTVHQATADGPLVVRKYEPVDSSKIEQIKKYQQLR